MVFPPPLHMGMLQGSPHYNDERQGIYGEQSSLVNDRARRLVGTAIMREVEPSGFASPLRRETLVQGWTYHTAFCLRNCNQ